jgi:Glucodextranase, domain B
MIHSSNYSHDETSNLAQDTPSVGVRRRRLRRYGVVGTIAVLTGALLSGGCGSTTTTTTQHQTSAAATLEISSPTAGSVLSADRITVRGTVVPASAAVQVQGHPAAVGNGFFTGTATIHGGKTTIDVIASAPGAAPASASVVVSRPSTGKGSRVVTASVQATPSVAYAASGSGETPCGGGLSVGPNTTCAFAENVRSAYDGSGPGTVIAYSPVTNRTYAMSCSGGASVVCTGGVGATVYFPGSDYRYSGSQAENVEPASRAARAGSYSRDYAGQTSCGGGLSVGANTTCAFAENVRSAYDQSGPGTVSAYSPVTNRTYAMTCSEAGAVICTGADHASVYFP